ncbi:MAG: hypothetical protein M0Z29_10870 [Actinomycetota bacterium]|nr:hypothetical protein [Actinomycetota bacterium]
MAIIGTVVDTNVVEGTATEFVVPYFAYTLSCAVKVYYSYITAWLNN